MLQTLSFYKAPSSLLLLYTQCLLLPRVIFLPVFHWGNSFVLFTSEHVRSCEQSSLKALPTLNPVAVAHGVEVGQGKTKPQFVIVYVVNFFVCHCIHDTKYGAWFPVGAR